MKNVLRWLALLATCGFALFAHFAHAAPLAKVEAVQGPAWLDHNGRTSPLAPDVVLNSGDVLRTGSDARVYVLLAEGSRVKLGANARFSLHSHSREPEKSWHGVLNVAAGAFRYTSDVVRKRFGSERQLAIRVGTSTIGIRGTDLWGRASENRDTVALLSGRIDVTRGAETYELEEVMTYLDAPRSGDVIIRPLESGQLARWARETEIQGGDGAAHGKGRQRAVLATLDQEAAALDLYDTLREAGYAVRIHPVRSADGAAWRYELFMSGFDTPADAAVAARRVENLVNPPAAEIR